MGWFFSIFTQPATSPLTLERLQSRRRRLRRRAWLTRFSFAAFLVGAGFARATTVTPPSFPELVAESDVIARASVTDISSRWTDGPQGRLIKTFVTFAVEKPLKGKPGATLTLQFLGGTVGSDTLRVSGMPQFKVGETEVLFVQGNGVQFCPLVRFMHGRYHVRTNAASHRSYVTRDDDTPLTSTADVQTDAEGHGAPARPSTADAAMTSDSFETQIATEVSHQNR